MSKRIGALALLALIAALAIAGCGGDDDNGTTSGGSDTAAQSEGGGGAYGTPPAAAPNAEEGTTFVSLGNVPDLGMLLVDSKGMTLYDFHKDKGGQSSCYGECASAWPPLLTEGEPKPSNGAQAGQLGTTKRKDGTVQVTYAGHPLYTYVGDKKPGEANGNDIDAFGAEWYALMANGDEPED